MAIDYSTNLGYVRLLIGDTSDTPVLSDDQINAILNRCQGNIYETAAEACQALAALASRGAISFSLLIGNVKVDRTKIAPYYLKLAEEFRARAEVTDTEDFTVEWSIKLDPVTAEDQSEYADDEDDEYFDVWYGNSE